MHYFPGAKHLQNNNAIYNGIEKVNSGNNLIYHGGCYLLQNTKQKKRNCGKIQNKRSKTKKCDNLQGVFETGAQLGGCLDGMPSPFTMPIKKPKTKDRLTKRQFFVGINMKLG